MGARRRGDEPALRRGPEGGGLGRGAARAHDDEPGGGALMSRVHLSSGRRVDGVEDDAMIQRTRRKILISTQATTWSRFSGSVSDAKKFVVAMFRKV